MANKNIGRARILQQIKNMEKDKVQYLHAQPLQTDLYTWHFTFRGPENTDFHEGLYHGQIILPFQYPFKPPDIIFANKNGRFEISTKICLTITQYHTQQWNSAWTIRTMLQAVISLFNEKVVGHGYLQSSGEARRYYAKASQDYNCQKCGKISLIVKPRQPIQQEKMNVLKTQQTQNKEQDLHFKKLRQQTVQKKEAQIKTNSHFNSNQHNLVRQKIGDEKYKQKKTSRVQSQTGKQSQKINEQHKGRTKKDRKQVSSHVTFLQLITQGNDQYLNVMKSKKYVQ